MGILSKAIETNRLDLAAHALVLATINTLRGGPYDQKEHDKRRDIIQEELNVTPLNETAGFYAKVLDAAEAIDFEAASGTNGLDDEITLLRVKIKTLIAHDPDNLKLIMDAANMLAKLVKIKYSMTKEQKKGLGEAIRKAITEIGVPLGVAIINKKL